MMKRPVRRCVKCGVVLKYGDILAAGPFPCPSCQTRLQAPSSYGRWILLGSLIFSALVLRVLGLDGFHLLYATLLAWVVVNYLAIQLLKYAIPPKIDVYVPRDSTLRLGDGPRSPWGW